MSLKKIIMKNSIKLNALIFLCFVNLITAQNNKKNNLIDGLSTSEEVVEFAKSVFPSFNNKYNGNLIIKATDTIIKNIDNCKLYQSWEIKNWEKIDLNNDKDTDLLFTGYWNSNFSQFAIISEEEKYSLFILSDNINYGCKILKPIVVNKKNQLLINNFKVERNNDADEVVIHYEDTITFVFNSFIEMNNDVADYDIENVKFILDHNFEVEIDNKGNAYYNCLNEYNVIRLKGDLYKGKSKKLISLNYFKELKDLMNYIKIKDLGNWLVLSI